jgi:hypothetical protein
VLRQGLPEQAELAARVAGGVLLVQPGPLAGLRGRFERLAPEDGNGAAVTAVMRPETNRLASSLQKAQAPNAAERAHAVA